MSSIISSFLKEVAITGNPVVDGLILAHIIPIIVTYAGTIGKIFFGLITFLGQLLLYRIKAYFQTKLMGENLGNVVLDDKSVLYSYLEQIIFQTDVQSDEINNSTMMNFINYTKDQCYGNSQSEVGGYYNIKKWWHRKKKIEMNINYQSDKVFNYNNVYKHIADKKIKYFKHGDFHFEIIHGQKEKSAYIKIKITYFGNNTNIKNDWDNEKTVNIVREFLNERFNFNQNIDYAYTLNIDNCALRDKLYSYIGNGLVCSNSGLLKYGDKTEEFAKEESFACEKMVLDVYDSNLTSDKINYRELIQLTSQPSYDSKKYNDKYGFKYLIKKYKLIGEHEHYGRYGYFRRNNVTFILYDTTSRGVSINNIVIISHGKLLKIDEIKTEIDWIINDMITNNSLKNDISKRSQRVIYKRIRGAWTGYSMDIRTFDTIYLPVDKMNNIKTEIDNFIQKETLYREYQIPYKKGILFYGPPGTGKTSLVKSIAYEYQMDIYMININDEEINDDSISTIINSISDKNKKILLFEDIDSAFADKEKLSHEIKTQIIENNNEQFQQSQQYQQKSKEAGDKFEEKDINKVEIIHNDIQKIGRSAEISRKYLTYSGLLNALDGVLSNQHGVITIMTTNYIKKLGDAFLRPGRIDAKFELTFCNKEQITMMMDSLIRRYDKISNNNNGFRKYDKKDKKYIDGNIQTFADKLTDVHGMSKIKPCQLQFYILKHIDNLENLFSKLDQIIPNQ